MSNISDFLLEMALDHIEDCSEDGWIDQWTEDRMVEMNDAELLDVLGYLDIYEFLEEMHMRLSDFTIEPTGFNKNGCLLV